MTGRESVGTRSSPRLRNKFKRSINSHCSTNGTTSDPSPEQGQASLLYSSAPESVYLPQSLLAGCDIETEIVTNTPAVLRTTTSRRGGRFGPVPNQMPRSKIELGQKEIEKEKGATDRDKERDNIMKYLDQQSSVTVPMHTPSTAAAAAAAAAKAFCDHPSRGRYDIGSSSSFFDERQNVFRSTGEEKTVSRITTKTRSDGAIRKPGMSYGNSTVRVMGSATPTHISTRHYDSCTNQSRQQEKDNRYQSPTKSQSVFRQLRASTDDMSQLQNPEASPQQLLMSLNCGSRSFELKSPGGNLSTTFRNHGDSKNIGPSSQPHAPLSPEAPPEIQHSHHQMTKAEFFLDPRTPKTPKTPNIDYARSDNFHGTPSFSLFNQSFDSLVDSSYLRSPNDQPIPVNFSLMYASPQKKLFMASPGSNFHGFSFSPTRQHTDDLEDFVEGSPGITLDNCIVDVLDDAPLMPRTRNAPTDALGRSEVMILDSNKSVRDIPTASNQSPRVNSTDHPLPKSNNTVTLEHHSASFLQRSPGISVNSSIQVKERPSVVRFTAKMQEEFQSSERCGEPEQMQRTPLPNHNYRAAIPPPPHIYRSGLHSNFYQPKKKATTLVDLDLDEIHERFYCHRGAFHKCSYLLPGFKSVIGDSKMETHVEESRTASCEVVKAVSPDRDGHKAETEVNDTENSVIASRRVDSAICAFGGQVIKKDSTDKPKTYYSNAITNRYFEHESRISWDVEESPPIESPRKMHKAHSVSPTKRVNDDLGKNPKTPNAINTEDVADGLETSNRKEEEGSDVGRGDAPRMKYRCKLCGKPKQNHICPYQKSLQRSIGISVYPDLNDFAASEPGNLAPSLMDMNNFLREENVPEITPSRPPKRLETSIFRGQHQVAHRSSPHVTVTPETLRSIKAPSPYSYQEPYKCPSHMIVSPVRNIRRKRILSPEKGSSRAQLCQLSDLVFMESMPLREEQFRAVCSKDLSSFEYPCIPLPYVQRKTLSDNLFELSKELPTLKEECAIVLRKAREDDMWDIAVAELLTQVIVAIHCPPDDCRLEGLSRYLNSMGFAC